MKEKQLLVLQKRKKKVFFLPAVKLQFRERYFVVALQLKFVFLFFWRNQRTYWTFGTFRTYCNSFFLAEITVTFSEDTTGLYTDFCLFLFKKPLEAVNSCSKLHYFIMAMKKNGYDT